MLLAETKPIKPGEANTRELVVKKSPLNTIAFTGTDGVNHPNGKTVPFDFQWAANYTPYKTVLSFLGRQYRSPFTKFTIGTGVGGIG